MKKFFKLILIILFCGNYVFGSDDLKINAIDYILNKLTDVDSVFAKLDESGQPARNIVESVQAKIISFESEIKDLMKNLDNDTVAIIDASLKSWNAKIDKVLSQLKNRKNNEKIF